METGEFRAADENQGLLLRWKRSRQDELGESSGENNGNEGSCSQGPVYQTKVFFF